MKSRLHALVVPFFIAVMSLAYWVQVAGARPSVILVPSGILVLIAIFLVIVVVQELRSPPEPPHFAVKNLLAPAGLIGLSIAYYFAFTTIGFHVANLAFVLLAALLMKIRPLRALITALFATLVLFLLAWAMNFNVPDPFWTR